MPRVGGVGVGVVGAEMRSDDEDIRAIARHATGPGHAR
jgi:hypothetical protein